MQHLKGPGRKTLSECLPAANTQTALYRKQCQSAPTLEPMSEKGGMWELQDLTCVTVIPGRLWSAKPHLPLS